MERANFEIKKSRMTLQVIGLIPRFALSVRVARAEAAGQPTDAIPGADTADDEDTMKGMARLFAEIGEACTVMIASGDLPKLMRLGRGKHVKF